MEIKSTQVDEAKIGEVSERLKEAPPVSFDVARQVTVFKFQYVDLRLTRAILFTAIAFQSRGEFRTWEAMERCPRASGQRLI